ncbi:MAG TPA: electron transporter RnfD [Microscillaceae bacterium]|nr:electron transporter RnfD [Microscillaceae bacterium]
MRLYTNRILFLIALISSLGIAFQSFSQSTNFIAADAPGLDYFGRINYANPKMPEFYWPGTSVELRFRGSSFVNVLMEDEKGKNYFNVILNGNSLKPNLFRCKKGKGKYQVLKGLDPKQTYRVTIFKRTETDEGYTKFAGIELSPDAQLVLIKRKRRPRIEFYGNSITAGMGNEDLSGRKNTNPAFKNNYLSYAAITARELDLEYRCIAKSGIGVMVSWYDMIMPEMYHRLHPEKADSRHDFTDWVPDIVVVNLFQNDSWLVNMAGNPNHKKRFVRGKPQPRQIVQAYVNFIRSLRKVYPKTHIVCTLGSMNAVQFGKPWKGYITQAVAQMKQRHQDQKLHTVFFAYNNRRFGHPVVADHRKMANRLKKYLQENILKR